MRITRHPSGKPIRDNKPKGRSIWRVPDSGYVTPRLQDRKTDAIGFVHDFSSRDDLDTDKDSA